MAKAISPDLSLLQEALDAFTRVTGLSMEVDRVGRHDSGTDARVRLRRKQAAYTYRVEIKTVKHRAALRMLKLAESAKRGNDPLLLVTNYMTPALAQECKELELSFLDTAGNAFINGPNLFLYIVGQPRPIPKRLEARFKAYTPAGLRLLFVVLSQPKMVNVSYRRLAEAAGVALGNIVPVMQDLTQRGFLVTRGGERQLQRVKGLIEDWVNRYPVSLRPKLHPRRYAAEPSLLQKLPLDQQGVWGGECAAQKLTDYLKPELYTLYLSRDGLMHVLRQARMRLDPEGNTEILEKFWNFPSDPQLAPPLLVYADLIASGDERNRETAQILYDRYLKPLHHL